MKSCACCGALAPAADAPVCLACGEASWIESADDRAQAEAEPPKPAAPAKRGR